MAGELGRRAFLKILGVVAGATAIGLDPILGRFAEGTRHLLIQAPPAAPLAVTHEQLVEIARVLPPELPPLFNEHLHQLAHDVLRFLGHELKDQDRFDLAPPHTRCGDHTRVRDPFPAMTIKDWYLPVTTTVREVAIVEQYTIDMSATELSFHERTPQENAEWIRDGLARPTAAKFADVARKKGINLWAVLPMVHRSHGHETVVAVDRRAGLAVRAVRVLDYFHPCGPTHRVRLDILGGCA